MQKQAEDQFGMQLCDDIMSENANAHTKHAFRTDMYHEEE